MLIFASTGYASSSIASDYVDAVINRILEAYPDDSYFTVNRKACNHSTNTTCNNCNVLYIWRAEGRSVPNGYTGAWTCRGYAKYVFNELWDENNLNDWLDGSDEDHPLGGSNRYIIENAKKGDYLAFGSSHAAIYLGYNSDGTIRVIHNNLGGDAYHTGKIKLDNSYNPSGLYWCVTIAHAKSYDSKMASYNPCNHKWNAQGVCTVPGCNAEWPDTRIEKSGRYKCTEKGAYLKSRPYSDPKETYSKNYSNSSIPVGTVLDVDYAVINRGGNTWYHVLNYQGKAGWVFDGQFATCVGALETTVEFKDMTQPDSTIQLGKTFSVNSGTITAKNGTIGYVRAFFYSDGSTAPYDENSWIQKTQYFRPNVGKSGFQIKGNQTIDNELLFNRLGAGTYRYGVIVTDSNKNVIGKWSSKAFTVASQSAPAQPVKPVCKVTISTRPTTGGVNVTVTPTPVNASVQITANGTTYQSTGAKTVLLQYSQTVSAVVTASGHQNGSDSKYISVSTCAAPVVNTNETPDGTVAALTCPTSGASIYYSLDGSNYAVYQSPLGFTASQTIYAYAEKQGCPRSETIQQTISVTAPSAPAISSGELGSDVAVGTTIAVSWKPVHNASSYEVTITGPDGSVAPQIVTQSQASVTANEAGIYELQVRARNAAGLSEASNAVRVTAHAPATVRFVDHDGTLLTEQTVKWGEAAVRPSAPERRGHKFSGWDRSFEKVTGDLTVTAQYEVNFYRVRFYDYDGETLLTTQNIEYNKSIDSDTASKDLSEKTGHAFVGWRVVSANDPDSKMDPEHVDSGMSLVAVQQWKNAELPIVIDNVSATMDENDRTGEVSYEVSYNITTAQNAVLGDDTAGIKVIAVLKSNQTSESGEPIQKVMALAVDTVKVRAGQLDDSDTKPITVTLGKQSGHVKADAIEVYALALDGADRTGGALSEVATPEDMPEIEAKWSPWSDTKPNVSAEIRERTMYRYRDDTKTTYSTTTNKQPQTSLSGWNYTSSDWSWSHTFTSYSPISEAGVEQVSAVQETVTPARTEYRYGRWTNGSVNTFCPDVGQYNGGGSSWWIEWTGWSSTPYQKLRNSASVTGYRVFYCSYIGSHTHHFYIAHDLDKYGDHNWYTYSANGAYSESTRWFWEESRYVPAVTRTKYTYRYKIYTNYFWKWVPGTLSAWSPDQPAAKDGRFIDASGKQYSYKTNNTSWAPDTSGQEYTLDISAPLSGDLEGKLATVLIYRTRNTDPTEAQLEYVDQVTLGEDASFTLTLKNKEDPSERTGDYTVALAVQGGGNLINVGQIKYDAAYTVKFTDGEGNPVGEPQEVRRGESVEAPEQPVKDGYRFVKWDGELTDVQSNMEIPAVWMPETWTVVFVDHVNQTVEMQNDLETGTLLPFPEVAPQEGYEFEGWSVRRSSDDSEVDAAEAITVDANLIAVANWKQKTYTVNFMDADGSVIETQQVPYGDAATPPESIDAGAGKVFLGWLSDFSWWSVTEDMDVLPIVAYEETVSAPIANLDSYVSGIKKVLELTAEDGVTIYYREYTKDSDTSEYTVDSDSNGKDKPKVYTEPIELTKDTTIRAFAASDGKNASEAIEINFVYQETAEEEPRGQVINLQTINAIAEPSQTVELRVNLQDNPGLLSYQFVLQADPSVFGVPCDEDGNMLLAQSLGNAGDNLFVTPYDPELGGWMVFWFSAETYRENGPLLSLSLKTFDETPAGAYPIKLGYIAENTVTEDHMQAAIGSDSLQLAMGAGARLGDVSGDGLITAVDVIRIAKYLVKDYTFTVSQLAAADVTGDGKVTAADVIRLARYMVGLAELGA